MVDTNRHSLAAQSIDELIGRLRTQWAPRDDSTHQESREITRHLMAKLQRADFTTRLKAVEGIQAFVQQDQPYGRSIHQTRFREVFQLAYEACQTMDGLIALRKHASVRYHGQFLLRAIELSAPSHQKLADYLRQFHAE